MNWMEKLKRRWEIQSTWRMIVVLIAFALTGSTLLVIKPFILKLIFQDEKPGIWVSVLYYTMSPIIYNILLLFYGAVFGQFSFFWNFEKKFFRRITSLFKKRNT